MWALYILGIQALRGGWWRLVLPVTLVALLADWAMNYTVFALLMWDWPRASERTFSKRLRRLQYAAGLRGRTARFIAVWMLDPFDPTGQHIKP
jgi:hypothetical protein